MPAIQQVAAQWLRLGNVCTLLTTMATMATATTTTTLYCAHWTHKLAADSGGHASLRLEA